LLRRFGRLAAREDGFTLVELMVVVTILSVLMLMATSTFSGVKSRAQDSAARQTAAKALEVGRIVFTDSATYATVTAAELNATEPNITFRDGTLPGGESDDPGTASIDVPDRLTTGYTFVAAVWSDSGKCYFIRDWITFGIGYAVLPNATTADCTAAFATANPGLVVFSTRWPSS
jgi:prepilin-type N-terminal cleavage/methylation domain-containing protein